MRSQIALFVIAFQAFAFGASAQTAPPSPLSPEGESTAPATEPPATKTPATKPSAAPAVSKEAPTSDEGDGLPADVDASTPVTTATAQTPPADSAIAPPSTNLASRRQRREKQSSESMTLTQLQGGVARDLTIDDVDWTLWTGAGLAAGTAALGIGTAIGAIVGGAIAADLGERKRNGEPGVYQAQQSKGVADIVTGAFAFSSVAVLTLAAVFSGVGFHRLEEAKWTPGVTATEAPAPIAPPPSTSDAKTTTAPIEQTPKREPQSATPSVEAAAKSSSPALLEGRATPSNDSEEAKADDDTGSPSGEVVAPPPTTGDATATP